MGACESSLSLPPYRAKQVSGQSRRLPLREGAVPLQQPVEQVRSRHEVHFQDLKADSWENVARLALVCESWTAQRNECHSRHSSTANSVAYSTHLRVLFPPIWCVNFGIPGVFQPGFRGTRYSLTPPLSWSLPHSRGCLLGSNTCIHAWGAEA